MLASSHTNTEESSEENYDDYMDDVAAVAAFMSVLPAYGHGVSGFIGCDVVSIPNANKGKNKENLLPSSPPVLSDPPNKNGGEGVKE